MRARATILVAAAALLAASLPAARSSAASAAPHGAQGGHLLLGVMDDALLGTQPDLAFRSLRELRPQVVRWDVDWPAVAPRRPANPLDPDDRAYRFARTDALVTRANAAGIRVLLTITHTPAWAGGGPRHNHAPRRLADLRRFAFAVAARYDGQHRDAQGMRLPRVRLYEAWNEPNTQMHLAPQWIRRRGLWQPASPAIYAGLLRSIYAGVHAAARAAHESVQVAGGATKPTGNGPTSSEPSVAPLRFAASLAALHPPLDAYSHHPYRTTRSGRVAGPGSVGVAQLPLLLGTLDRGFGGRRLHLWITEYGVQTNPPDRYLGVAPSKQAALLRQTVAASRANPRIDVLIWFLIRDEATGGRAFAAGFQTGLATVGGRPKPAWRAFASLTPR